MVSSARVSSHTIILFKASPFSSTSKQEDLCTEKLTAAISSGFTPDFKMDYSVTVKTCSREP